MDLIWCLFRIYKIAEEYGFAPLAWDSFEVKSVSEFLGSYYAKGKPISYVSDTLQYIDPLIVSYEASGTSHDSLIDKSELDTHDKYSAFLYGNHGFANIKVKETKNPKRLLHIKDSYANSLVHFLVNHYDEIDVVDLRHYSGSLKTILESKDYNNVLFLHSFSQFSSDKSVVKLRY